MSEPYSEIRIERTGFVAEVVLCHPEKRNAMSNRFFLEFGRAFQENGWALQPGDVLDLDDLPAHSTMEDGEAVLKPCAEVLLSQRAARLFGLRQQHDTRRVAVELVHHAGITARPNRRQQHLGFGGGGTTRRLGSAHPACLRRKPRRFF